MTIEDIINWCVSHKKTDWLKKEAAKTVECKVYPRKMIINEKGKKVSVADRSQKPVIDKRPISFVSIKYNFAREFMPEIIPVKAAKEPTMYEIIAGLK
jgi:hypothetical protein